VRARHERVFRVRDVFTLFYIAFPTKMDETEVILQAGIMVGYDVHIGNAKSLVTYLLKDPIFAQSEVLQRHLNLRSDFSWIKREDNEDLVFEEDVREFIFAIGPMYEPLRILHVARCAKNSMWKLCAEIGEFAIGVQVLHNMIIARISERPAIVCDIAGEKRVFDDGIAAKAMLQESLSGIVAMKNLSMSMNDMLLKAVARRVLDAITDARDAALALIRFLEARNKNVRR